MARKSGNTAPAGANKNADIRSFFGAGRAAAKASSAVTSSQVSQNSASQSSSATQELQDCIFASAQTRDVKPQRKAAVSKSLSPKKTHDENTNLKAAKSSAKRGPTPTAGQRPALTASNLNTSMSSLSELQDTPVLSPPMRRVIRLTPIRQRSQRSRSGTPKGTVTPKTLRSGRSNGSPRKVRFSSLPSSPRLSPEPEEPMTPRRLLFGQSPGRKTASESPRGSPPAGELADLPSLQRGKLQRTPKRDISGEPKVDGTPNSLPSLPSLPSSPALPSSPPTTKKRPILTRDAVIKGSDDEDDDGSLSDDSFPDLDMLGPTKPRPDGTPKAKRRARLVHKSPLTIQPKHKFDFKTLDAHSRRHDVLFESPRRPAEPAPKDDVMVDTEESPSKARQKLIEIAGVKTEEDADKALRAMERTDAGASRTRWYFFKKDVSGLGEPAPFPKKYAKGPWSFLEKPGTRDWHIMSGMPNNLAVNVMFPDELYLWILGMVTVEKFGVLRGEYSKIATANDKQVKRLITPQLLEESLRRLGAADFVGDEVLRPVRESRDIYADRDWEPLQSFLEWMAYVAHHLTYETVAYAVKILLRMAADKMVLENVDVLMHHQNALAALVDTVKDSVWNEFCTEICSSLYHGFDKTSLRMLPLICMPVTSRKLHELRRRLAVAFFLRDAALANEHPDDVISLRLVIARVKDSDFKINNKTDYVNLKALVQLLDMAVDDGAFARDDEDLIYEKEFNADIDDLAKRLKAIWRGINDTGAANLARTEAKSVLEWVGERLTYSVRTKRPPTQSIFGEQGPSSAKKRRQQDFMQKFVRSRKNKPSEMDTGIEPASSEDETFVTAIG
ncbi:hypothetical protein CORC01_08197 [Colletotrichum orchidophilum]|uniref:Uncharacterized protein n=1 Tax=Colletotrichum orchidophilum TaxID=1209926 RepID=A0A1G4B4V7_9PEZI|nr:uncharacterized protein CORC01_08197 [Colletotrichum orchidophilum]OHE96434.1 hypothetical protein CORC01_08197 [Colletotrichum orchidophilum]